MAKRRLAAKLNLLSSRQVLNARDAELSDGGGLLLRCADGQAAWVFRYTSPAGKRREMGLGTCSRHSPQAAGESLTLARAARTYHENFIEPRRRSKFAADWIRSLENHVPPELWHKPIAEITRAELLDFLRDIQHRMADTAQRVRRRLDEVFEEAIEREAVALNPVAMLRTKLRRENQPKRPAPHAALPFGAAPQFVAHLRGQPGIAARCLEFTILTAARTGESIGARWSEFDLKAALWTVPGERMKGGEPHAVPLSERAVAVLREMQALDAPYVFPTTKQVGPMSNMAMLALLKRMKRADITVHGFRATFSTWANETAAARPDVIEACLAHRESDRVRAAYNRAQFAAERRKLLEAWDAYLDGREPASNVIPLAGAKAA
jgi:integrase